MAMSMNNLKVFVNVADAANITRAAEVLHIILLVVLPIFSAAAAFMNPS